ncbi:MAG: heat-inducible transcriptional repressor HrcA [Eubacteriales bacterium]|nr:heat-inducible transcriptional repressor HrcA [Eubacteriales bacterium]
MELDERKLKILKAIISNYLETGEPVGSRTISKYTDLNLSSATIRNEMADLEELGYIMQPHTSAGRIPTDAGYRLYVDRMMLEKDVEMEEMKTKLLDRVDKMETMLKQVAKVLAYNTNYATMVSAPQYQNSKLKFIQLTQVDEHQLLAVIVVDGNVIKNKLMQVTRTLANDEVLKLNVLLNTFLQGASLQDINLEMIQTIKAQAGEFADIMENVFQGIAEAIHEADEVEIYTSGTSNMLKYPELGTIEQTTKLLEALEDRQGLNELVDDAMNSNENHGIQVYIGEEAPVSNMKDCSIVTATYELAEGGKGTIGIIGPKRMDYQKVVSTLKNLTGELDTIFKKKE